MRNVAFIISLFALFSCVQKKVEISEWRGPNRSGIYNETNLLKEWPEDGPKLIWSNEEIGNGYGSPVFTGDVFYITGETDSTAYLFKFKTDGSLLWKKPFGNEWVVNWSGSRSAPTVVGTDVYVLTGKGDLSCLDAVIGDKKWSLNILEKYSGINTRFGLAEAIYVDGDKIYCMPGGTEHNVVALNRHTGDLIWSSKALGERPGYNSPQMINLPERKILVTFSAYHLIGIDAETGELLWSHEQTNTKPEERGPGIGDTHANTILYENGFIYYVAGDGNGGVKLQLSEDGKSISEVWINKDFNSYMGGIVKVGDKIFGDSATKQLLNVADANTGAITDSLKVGHGSVIAADNLLYFYSFGGKVRLIDYSNKLTQLSEMKITMGTKEHFAHPVIHRGVLYVRHGNALMAYDIKRKDV